MNLKRSLFLLAVLALSTLACILPITVQSTPTAQVITVVVTAEPTPQPPTAVPPTAEPTAEPTVPATAALVLTAQAGCYGITFGYPQPLASNISCEIVPANPATAEVPTWDVYPEHYLFSFNNYILSGTFHDARLRVFPIDEFASMVPYVGDIHAQLQQLLTQRPTSIGADDSLPFLPIWNAAQILQSNIRYMDFANGQGVRYLSLYGQAAYPANNQMVFYTFQGLTSDGQYYISAVLPVNNPALPNTPEEGIPNGDWMAFSNNFTTYVAETEAMMSALADESFTPSLAELDAMMASLSVNP